LRLAVPVGGRQGRVRGYASEAERFAKQGRLQHLEAELAEVDGRLAAGRVSVCRGGRWLARQLRALNEAKLISEKRWAHWRAERLFLTADGDAEYPLGNGSVMVHPEQRWCEIKLPGPLAHLANGNAGRYRLACPVVFTHRVEEWAAQVATGAVRYDITFDPTKGRWYLHASWRLPKLTPPGLEELRQDRALGSTSTPTTWPAGCSTHLATRSAHPIPSPSTSTARPPRPATGGCGRQLALSLASASTVAAGRSWWRTSTSPTPARPAGKPSAAAGAASASAG
jgi:hypothetical protein